MRLTLLLFLSACAFITDEQEDARKDPDGDGIPIGTDCDDGDATIGRPGTWYADADGDGFGSSDTVTACVPGSGYVDNADDCDDTDAAFHPGAEESDCADPHDYNCDGSVGGADGDGDGFASCQDCNDADASVNPDAVEVCNEQDDDCDGDADGGATDAIDWYVDADGDGWGAAGAALMACTQPDGSSRYGDDCDDADASIHPGGVEVCDASDTDEDCDGESEESGAGGESVWYEDADGDGFGSSVTVSACSEPSGYVAVADDCDDADAAYNPGATEGDCSDLNDYNCDGFTGYADLDADGWAACDECDDGNASINPGATEVCNGADDDCDGDADGGAVDSVEWYEDGDGDGYGSGRTQLACTAPVGFVAEDGDCDDGVGAVNPGAVERCDLADTDEDCDGLADDASAARGTSWYADVDGDGFGAGVASTACDAPGGSVASSDDCDDASASAYPGAAEVTADGIDQDCDSVDQCYTDADSDNYGTTVVVDGSTLSCSTGTGAPVATDCDDTSATDYPGASETVANSDDEDCDGVDSCYTDADGDNYGTTVVVDGSSLSCSTGTGASNDDDCDDTSAAISPADAEITADGIDQDCDSVDQCYTDADGDNYGTTVVVDGSSLSCSTGTGAAVSTDCDDTSAAISPADAEVCADTLDNDCDGLIDTADPDCVVADYSTLWGSEMIVIPAGSYSMGSGRGDSSGSYIDHTVTLTHDFWIGQTEITRGQWESWSGGVGWAYSTSYPCTGTTTNCPTNQVSWYDVAQYANALSTAEGLTPCYLTDGTDLAAAYLSDPYSCPGYRLPTEAEWEYAARAGEDTTYSGSNTAADVAWTYETAYSLGTYSHEVAMLAPNAWGLYDMSGNQWEWTNDWYSSSYDGYGTGSAITDPPGPTSGSFRVFRGGSWFNFADSASVACRSSYGLSYRGSFVAARLSRSIP